MTGWLRLEERRRLDGVLAAVLLALGAGLYLISLKNGFAYDDPWALERSPVVRQLRNVLVYFESSYWGPSSGADSAYRPMTVLVWAVQWFLGDGSPFLFHAVNVALYAIACSLTYGVLRFLFDAPYAAFGTLAFAVTPLHVEVVANVVGQAELWVYVLLAPAILLYAEARASSRGLTVLRAVAITGLYGLALCFKEHAVVLPGLLLAYEALLGIGWRRLLGPDGFRPRVLTLMLGVVAAVFIAVRVQIAVDDIPHWDIRELGAVDRAIVMLRLFPTMLRLLFWPAHLSADYSSPFVSAVPALDGPFLYGLAWLVALLVAAVGAARALPALTLGLVWAAMAVLPTSNLLFATGILIAERTLFLASLGAAIALAAAAVPAWALLTRVSRGARLAAVTTVGALLALGAGLTLQRIPSWVDNAAVFSQLVHDAPNNARSWFALGEMNELGGRRDVADTLYQRAIALNPKHMPMALNYALFLQSEGRCEEALPILRQLSRDNPNSEMTAVPLAGCSLSVRRYSDGRLAALLGQAAGSEMRNLKVLRQAAESLLVATDSVDVRNRYARSGKPFDKTGGRYTVLVLRSAQARADVIRRMQRDAVSATAKP